MSLFMKTGKSDDPRGRYHIPKGRKRPSLTLVDIHFPAAGGWAI